MLLGMRNLEGKGDYIYLTNRKKKRGRDAPPQTVITFFPRSSLGLNYEIIEGCYILTRFHLPTSAEVYYYTAFKSISTSTISVHSSLRQRSSRTDLQSVYLQTVKKFVIQDYLGKESDSYGGPRADQKTCRKTVRFELTTPATEL